MYCIKNKYLTSFSNANVDMKLGDLQYSTHCLYFGNSASVGPISCEGIILSKYQRSQCPRVV